MSSKQFAKSEFTPNKALEEELLQTIKKTRELEVEAAILNSTPSRLARSVYYPTFSSYDPYIDYLDIKLRNQLSEIERNRLKDFYSKYYPLTSIPYSTLGYPYLYQYDPYYFYDNIYTGESYRLSSENARLRVENSSENESKARSASQEAEFWRNSARKTETEKQIEQIQLESEILSRSRLFEFERSQIESENLRRRIEIDNENIIRSIELDNEKRLNEIKLQNDLDNIRRENELSATKREIELDNIKREVELDSIRRENELESYRIKTRIELDSIYRSRQYYPITYYSPLYRSYSSLYRSYVY